MRRLLAFALAGLLGGALLLVPPPAPASALTDSWAQWGPITGASNGYATTMQQASAGFPAATVATDSRGNVQVAAGGSTFLGAGTPPGAKYGSSAGNAYLVLRPKADTATAPSTTTYTFDAPTPDTGWAFVLGDIDADQVRVAATDAGGDAVPAAEIDSWYRGAFNYAGGSDLPSWDGATSTLVGNDAAADTDGAAGWFEPTEPLTSLTLTFTARAGFPVYQAWFVSRARPITGTVADVSSAGQQCPVQDSVLTLVSPSGEELATTSPEADGTYDLGEYATQAGYVVRLTAPVGCAVVGEAQRTVDNRGNDGSPGSIADFEVRQVIPQPISGTVRDAAGNPVPGVAVTLERPDGSTVTTSTDSDGFYLFDDNPSEDEPYTIAVDVPGGYLPGPDGDQIDGLLVADSPVVDQDFVIVALAAVSGVVSGGGSGLGGVQVTLTPTGGGDPVVTVTRGDGSYDLTGVPAGDYTLAIDPPEGYSGETSRAVIVGADDLTDEDFALERPGGVSGSVVNETSEPVEGVTIVVSGPDGDQELVTDGDGGYFLDGLPPGTYRITVLAPDGTEVEGPAIRTVVITEAGELVGDQDFALTQASEPTDPPTDPTTPPTDPPTDAASDPTDPTTDPGGSTSTTPPAGGAISETGADVTTPAGIALALLLTGAAALLLARRRAQLRR